MGLLERMRKVGRHGWACHGPSRSSSLSLSVYLCACVSQEGYLSVCAADQQDGGDTGDSSKTVYTFGPRFHLEIGLLNLARSFYTMLGQPPDEGGYLQSLRQELEAAEGD